jgi:Avidin family
MNLDLFIERSISRRAFLSGGMSGQKITGRYRSPVSSGGGTVDGDLVGWADGDLISFVVNWTSPASLTAWTGQLVAEGGRDVIKTLWLLVQNVPDASEPSGLWQSTLAGADQFWRV